MSLWCEFWYILPFQRHWENIGCPCHTRWWPKLYRPDEMCFSIERERRGRRLSSRWNISANPTGDSPSVKQYHIILLGGLSGRLDQTIHTLSYLHKLRKTRERVFAITDDNVGWVLDSVGFLPWQLIPPLWFNQGEHDIEINHDVLGKTCGILPVGIDSTILSTSGLEWNLSKKIPSWCWHILLSSFCSGTPFLVWWARFYFKPFSSRQERRLDQDLKASLVDSRIAKPRTRVDDMSLFYFCS